MSQAIEIKVPDLGDVDGVEVVEILVAAGDQVAIDDSLITLESDKASMDVPSTAAGTVTEIAVTVGDSVNEGAVILRLDADANPASSSESQASSSASESTAQAGAAKNPPAPQQPAPAPVAVAPAPVEPPASTGGAAPIDEEAFDNAYASPSVRKLARELGVDLGRVRGTGRKERITPEDLRSWVKEALQGANASSSGGTLTGFEWPAMPEIDFTKFGEVEEVKLSRIQKASKRNLHRSWLHVPHVTQHEDADVTELEAFRKAQSDDAKKRGIKLTPVAFLLKAAAGALSEFPTFNSSLHPAGDRLILKKFVHIGVAVDTPDGLVVPVIRDVDQKGVYQLAQEVVDASIKARDGKLLPKDFQGASFTISSLGGIGGTGFTPIVNAPEVAILGASRNRWQPVWNGSDFEPRLMLPLSVSYDHRVIDGATACHFTVYLAALLSDIRKLLL